MKSASSTSPFDGSYQIREQLKLVHGRLVELYEKAGIGDDIEKIEADLPSWPDRLDYVQTRQEEEEERRIARRRVRRRVRRAIFSVPDLERRKAIIALTLEEGHHALRWHRADHREERDRLRAQTRGKPAWAGTAAIGVVGLGLAGYSLECEFQAHHWLGFDSGGAGGLLGTIVGVGLAGVIAMVLRDDAASQQAQTVADTAERLAELDRFLEDVLKDEPLFTSSEEETAQPDRLAAS